MVVGGGGDKVAAAYARRGSFLRTGIQSGVLAGQGGKSGRQGLPTATPRSRRKGKTRQGPAGDLPNGPLPVEQACDYVRQTAAGLRHLHERGMVHRDLKPSNLLLSARDGRVKILDLGLARWWEVGEYAQTASELTGTEVAMGTPDYMA